MEKNTLTCNTCTCPTIDGIRPCLASKPNLDMSDHDFQQGIINSVIRDANGLT